MKISMLVPHPLELQQNISKDAAKPTEGNSFGKILGEQLKEVERLEKEADELTQNFLIGEIQDLHEVTIAAEKANLALQLTVQVRNKLLEAYQEISRMQI